MPLVVLAPKVGNIQRGSHEISHAQEGELLEVPRAGIASERRLGDPVEGVMVVALQCVLARQGHPCLHAGLDYLLQQACKPRWHTSGLVVSLVMEDRAYEFQEWLRPDRRKVALLAQGLNTF